ncbi:hypothetical protein chiPu_0003354 [Chiloscyllium punctatum]|uniref:Uncharacterized protein n=1 Tax=Chiloscyllium punctatum TaxID=137246 RepID=A0A401S3I5_CHIPU|nr:hypothetical protein [Chiloscyllium punctatum]
MEAVPAWRVQDRGAGQGDGGGASVEAAAQHLAPGPKSDNFPHTAPAHSSPTLSSNKLPRAGVSFTSSGTRRLTAAHAHSSRPISGCGSGPLTPFSRAVENHMCTTYLQYLDNIAKPGLSEWFPTKSQTGAILDKFQFLKG